MEVLFYVSEFSVWEEEAEGFWLWDPGISKSQMIAHCQDALLKGYLWGSFFFSPCPSLRDASGKLCWRIFFSRRSVTHLLPPKDSLVSLDLLKVYFLFPKGNVCFTAMGSRLRVCCLSEGGEVIQTSRDLEIALQSDGMYLRCSYLYHTSPLISELPGARHGRRQPSFEELMLLNQEGWTRREDVPGVTLHASDGAAKWASCCKPPGLVPVFTTVPAVKLCLPLLALGGLSQFSAGPVLLGAWVKFTGVLEGNPRLKDHQSPTVWISRTTVWRMLCKRGSFANPVDQAKFFECILVLWLFFPGSLPSLCCSSLVNLRCLVQLHSVY